VYTEENYPRPIFGRVLHAVKRTDIEPTDPKKAGFIALDENARPAVYLTEEHAMRAMKQFLVRESDRTFAVFEVSILDHAKGLLLDEELKRLRAIEEKYITVTLLMQSRVNFNIAVADKQKESGDSSSACNQSE
jgi:hypothetical protein